MSTFPKPSKKEGKINNFASSAPDNKISVRIIFHKCSIQICIHRNPDVAKGDRGFYDLLSKPELCLLVKVEEHVAAIRTDDTIVT